MAAWDSSMDLRFLFTLYVLNQETSALTTGSMFLKQNCVWFPVKWREAGLTVEASSGGCWRVVEPLR